jgi:hypothetical protein
VKYLPTFSKLCGFNFLIQSFVAVTLAKLRLGKVWLETKHAINASVLSVFVF